MKQGTQQNGGLRNKNVRAVLAALPSTECIPWPGKLNKAGYGWIDSKVTHSAARFIYQLVHPDIDISGDELDHLCHSNDAHCRGGAQCPHRPCVNPAHLEPVTRRTNAERGPGGRASCSNGHLRTPDNTYLHNGLRYCRDCRREYDRTRPSGGARARKAAA